MDSGTGSVLISFTTGHSMVGGDLFRLLGELERLLR